MTAGRDFQSCEEFDIFFSKKRSNIMESKCVESYSKKNENLFFFYNILRKKKSISREKTKTFFSLCEIVIRPMQLATQ